jgi:hypothetical protein
MSSLRLSGSGIGRVGMRCCVWSGRRLWRGCVASGPLPDAENVWHWPFMAVITVVFCVSIVLLFR